MKRHLIGIFFLVIINSLCLAQNPTLWGMTSAGGTNNLGTIFNYNINAGTEIDKYNFVGSPNDGRVPYSTLIKGNNGLLYGMTQSGGTYHAGTIFTYNISKSTETDLHDFGSGTDGLYPRGLLIQASDSLLYGMTQDGGTYNLGMFFSYNLATGIETDLHDFGSGADGQTPLGSLVQASTGLIYGVVENGGTYGIGIIFSYNISNSSYSDVYNFGSGNDGGNPEGSLIQASNGLLYGMTSNGGINSKGTIFSYNIFNNIETDIHNFGSGTDGIQPLYGNLLEVGDSLLYGMTDYGGVNGITNGGQGDGIIFSYNISTGNYTILHDFGAGTDGKYPFASLIKSSNGLLYGMTASGGINDTISEGDGIIFSYDIATKKETDVYDFGSGTDGKNPYGGLIEVDTVTLSATPAKAAICAGSTVNLLAQGATTYTWSPATGLSATTGDSVIASPTITTIYTITGTGAVPTYPTTVTVTVIPNPTITVNAPLLICSGESTILTAGGATTYTWTPSTGFSSTTGSTVIVNASVTTTYTVIGTTNACSDTVQTTVTVISSPNKPSFYQHGDTLISSSTHDNQWYLNDTLLTGDTSQHLVITDTGNYWVIVANEANGCSTASDSMYINTVTGINQLSVNSPPFGGSIYPNPTTGEINIVSAKNIDDLKVTNLLGQLVYESEPKQTQFTFELKDDGMYFVTVTSGNETTAGKIVVNK